MKKLSSDILYYKALAGLIIGPILIVLFIRNFWVNNFSNIAVLISYLLLAAFVLFQWYKQSRTKQILYDNAGHIFIKSYYINRSLTIETSDVIRIKRVFSLAKKTGRMYYKLTYMYEGERHSVYFFIVPELHGVEDIEKVLHNNIV